VISIEVDFAALYAAYAMHLWIVCHGTSQIFAFDVTIVAVPEADVIAAHFVPLRIDDPKQCARTDKLIDECFSPVSPQPVVDRCRIGKVDEHVEVSCHGHTPRRQKACAPFDSTDEAAN